MSGQIVAVNEGLAGGMLPPAAQAELAAAAAQLQAGTGVLVRVADLLGGAMGRSLRLGVRALRVAPDFEERLRGLAAATLQRAFDASVLGMSDADRSPDKRTTRAVVMMSGAVGGFMGMGGFLPDVAVTTFAIMRSIARIAQEEGEDLASVETRRACLEVFALTPTGSSEADYGYFSARLMMQGRPLMLLIGEVSSRYGVSLSQKFALQAVPVVGAISGAALNFAFLKHYQDAARAHFVIRRLERSFGKEPVRSAWAGALAA